MDQKILDEITETLNRSEQSLRSSYKNLIAVCITSVGIFGAMSAVGFTSDNDFMGWFFAVMASIMAVQSYRVWKWRR